MAAAGSLPVSAGRVAGRDAGSAAAATAEAAAACTPWGTLAGRAAVCRAAGAPLRV
jgi:hypothetical protein